MGSKGGFTKKGTQPNPTTMPKMVLENGFGNVRVPRHPGRGRPAKGFNQATKTWEQWKN
jgi:hypothetical protein